MDSLKIGRLEVGPLFPDIHDDRDPEFAENLPDGLRIATLEAFAADQDGALSAVPHFRQQAGKQLVFLRVERRALQFGDPVCDQVLGNPVPPGFRVVNVRLGQGARILKERILQGGGARFVPPDVQNQMLHGHSLAASRLQAIR